MFSNIGSNKRVSVGNNIKLLYEIEYNLINPLPTYHFEKEKERNSLSISPSPIFFSRNRYSFSPVIAPIPYVKKMRYSLMKMKF
jgi:hypothetical protein